MNPSRIKLAGALMAFFTASALFAQTASTVQPKPKSNKEVEALNALFGAQDPDARIAAAENLIIKFADTQFKSIALYLATVSAEQKNDFEKIIIYGDRTIEADPKNFGAMLVMARALSMRTREFDLDKEEKLGRAEKLAKDALALIPAAVKQRTDIPDDQWEAAKKDFASQAHEAIGIAAIVRKKFDVAVTELKAAVEGQMQKDPSTYVRLATALTDSGQYDEAIAVCDQINTLPDVPQQVKSIAGQTKMKAAMAKAQKK
jgi:tetratricopeptide (TPR) repeat protein